ncbi:hypothetical protein ABEB36_005613 [Hypothenemus hampei]|uniref:Uncharacterized protein n=1 Tax=Hypothenemus hampei TaxID=57062 RepID=A0ABD1EYV4_HYPHA
MDEIAFQDWPGLPMDVNGGNNPWTPAYGFQMPGVLLEKEDFIGNPDAEYFLPGSTTHYMYLETIQEETSDDLRSDSDVDSRNSPVGWLATDSEDGSVICLDRHDNGECESDREIACPPKRRRQEVVLQVEDEEDASLSRSSSLLQFETLEKECQQESQSTCVFRNFTFDHLSKGPEDITPEYDGDVFKTFATEINRSKQNGGSRDSLLYNASTRYSSSDSSDSDTTVENSRSCDNLKTWRSFDSLLLNSNSSKKFSSENLSEDSGYGDQLLNSLNNFNKTNNSTGNLFAFKGNDQDSIMDKKKEKKNSYVGFEAYDCDVFQNFNTNFGVSYQDLSIFNRYDTFSEPTSKSVSLIDAFLRKKQGRQLFSPNSTVQPHSTSPNINLDPENSYSKSAKFSDCNVSHAASVPNLLQTNERLSPVDIQNSALNVCSVPKDLNFIGEFNTLQTISVAEKNLNLADLNLNEKSAKSEESGKLAVENAIVVTAVREPEHIMANYKREGSYSEAMSNRVDLSDDENSLRFKKALPKSPIVEFDRKVLKAISEQSLQSLLGSTNSLHGSQKYLEKPACSMEEKPIFHTSTPTKNKSVALSTPNLNRIEPVIRRERDSYFDDDRRKSTQEIASSRFDTTKLEAERGKNILLDASNDEDYELEFRRKGSIIKSSTSTSGMSDIEDKTFRHSISGSNGSKGVHFSPVVAEVNWQDDASTSTVTPDSDSLYSLNSSSPEPKKMSSKSKLIRPKPQYPLQQQQQARRSVSQPDISDNEVKKQKKEYIDSLNSLRNQEVSTSQPDVSKLRRRGSQLVKKDKDGYTVKAYVDLDGIQYRHTHLDINSLSQTSLNASNVTSSTKANYTDPIVQNLGSKNSLTSKFPFHQTTLLPHGGRLVEDRSHQSSNGGKQSNFRGAMDDDGSDAIAHPKRKNKSGLGGFLQRLASFRLGAKKGQEQKEKLKRKTQGNGAATAPSLAEKNPNLSTTGSEKPNYIYIPLKGPTSCDNNNTSPGIVSAAKPPLPKQPPPRVVHASVKKSQAQNGVGSALEERRRRRTIDYASGAGDIRGDVGRHGHGNVSMDGPMGLIETDLDTEVTVITNGANAKARSLLDLGHEPRLQVPQNADGSQNSSGRPHKSMEFLLDKQNLKVVEPCSFVPPYGTLV